MIRPLALVGKAAVMSVPSRSILRVAGRTKPGTVTSTSALPPLMRSARFDKVLIVVPLTGGAAGASLPPHPKSTNEARAAANAAKEREYFKICLRWARRSMPARRLGQDRVDESAERAAA